MNRGAAAHSPRARRGFTLIELMAVIAIFGLFLAFVAPNLSTLSGRYLAQQASRMQGALEYAREAAVVSARPHRFVLDLDLGSYQIVSEELPPELADPAPASGAPAADAASQAGAPEDDAQGPLSLAPPVEPEVSLLPVSGPLGSQTLLLDEVFFAGVQTEEGWTETGSVEVEFGADGVAAPILIVLEHDSGLRAGLEVLPLLESVRILGDDELALR